MAYLWDNGSANILDCTGNEFKVYLFKPDSYALLFSKAFDVVLDQSNLPESYVEFVDIEDIIKLHSFNDLITLIANEKEIVKIIFDAYFTANLKQLKSYITEPHIIIIVPMFWETEINTVLIETMQRYFHKNIDICTQAIPLFCNAVNLDSLEIKNITVCKCLHDAYAKYNLFQYTIEKDSNVYNIDYLDSKDSNDDSITKSKNNLLVTCNDKADSPEVTGLYKLMKYLQRKSAFQINFNIKPVLGIVHNQLFRPMLKYEDSVQSTTSYYYQIVYDEPELIDIPIAAQATKDTNVEFCLPRLQIRSHETIKRNSSIHVSMKKVTQRQVFAKIQATDKSILKNNMEQSIMLKYPALYY